ncbi:MAG: leucine-rich repeat protein [Clostridia bacterium]|nr:leucine-rich repeat protein [Clostridia bacterium]
MKKIVSFFLVMLLLTMVIPINLFSITASAATQGYYTYTVSNGEATITDVDELIFGDITIPSKLGGYPVTTIGYGAFDYCSGITNLVIPDSVTSIGYEAFYYCTGMKSITIGNGVTDIYGNAFYVCTDLETINIGRNVRYIAPEAFKRVDSLQYISVAPENKTYKSSGNCLIEISSKTILLGCNNSVIPNDSTVTTIGYEAFWWCILEDFTIPDSITTIGESAFDGAYIDTLTIGANVSTIGDNAFYACDIESINVSSANTKYYSSGNCVIERANKKLVFGCKNSVIPGNGEVKIIGTKAFASVDAENGIAIPNGVEIIEDRAFAYIWGPSTLVIPDSVTSIGSAAFESSYINSVILGKGVKTIGSRAFNDVSLSVVYLPQALTLIGPGAFAYDQGESNDSRNPMQHIYYGGTDKSNINIMSGNEELDNGEWHYGVPSYCSAVGHEYVNACDIDCNVCGETRTITHDFEWKIDLEQTCGDIGKKHEECTICHLLRSEGTIIPATGNHVFDDDYDGKCNICGLSRPPKCSTCTGTGSVSHLEDCTHCSGTGRTYITCYDCGGTGSSGTEEGFRTCSLCFGTGQGRDKVTCSTCYGSKGYYKCGICGSTTICFCDYGIQKWVNCSSCSGKGYQYSGDCNACDGWGKIYGTFAKDCPYCTDGKKSVSCGECSGGQISVDETCSDCRGTGYRHYSLGDLDGDSELTDWDGVMLARYLAGWSVEVSATEALDIDGDGEITDWDGVVLDRYLAGWNVEIG